ncbi:methylglyoxal synthase [Lacibacterium aquatile]|uniref:Methylglyoxal synthase n=1 Tax=Lacibacterium aquatile TaxID=1168082 RepID=A0ABW5DUX6_9PROT
MEKTPLRIAILASPSRRVGPNSDLVRLLRALEPVFREVLRPSLLVTDGVRRVLQVHNILADYEAVEPLPPAEEGAMATIAARIVTNNEQRAVDWVIYLTDPADPISLHPESLAIKRQCVVHGKPYLGTLRAAAEFCTLEALARDPAKVRPLLMPVEALPQIEQPGGRLLGLVAHDSRKGTMLDFAARHFTMLDRFRQRVSTGTTGELLNGTLPARLKAGWQAEADEAMVRERLSLPLGILADKLADRAEIEKGVALMQGKLAGRAGEWTHPFKSGPKGGDAEIAELILERPGATVIFFEDPHVAREHEADIQLLERAARLDGAANLCFHHAVTAERWAVLMEAALEAGDVPVLRALV